MPTHAGPYRIQQKLAESAITTLYRAEHELLGRTVLLKTLKDSLVQGSSLAVALEREAKILSRLAHPSIVRLLEVSSDKQTSWIALENIDGPSLALLLEKTPKLEVASAVAIALEIATALGHVHQRRILHRNIEPQGIAISLDGRVVLTDFNAATDFEGKILPSNFEAIESIRGPRHSAPEVIMDEPPTTHADVFSLGVVLYEMLCGTGPWDAGKPSALELARRIRNEDPTPMAEHGVAVPEALSRLVMRCLAKRPEERYEDGATIASALDGLLDELSTSSVQTLVTRALARAGLGEALVDDRIRRKPKKSAVAIPMRRLVGQLLSLLGLVIAGAIGIEGFVRERQQTESLDADEAGKERGYLRVLARPWAEIFIDGKLVDVTPVARPIAVTAGRHYVTFKHPNAPDEKREIRLTPGQTVVIDVTMRVDRRMPTSISDGGIATDASNSP